METHDAQRTAPVAMIVAHTKGEPPPPSRYAEQEIPAEMDALVLACLAKVPEGRPPTAGDIVQRLDGFAPKEAWTHERGATQRGTHWPVPGA